MDGYRIDVVRGQQLVEIQHGSLAAIEAKAIHLLELGHELLVVKPLPARKYLVKRDKRGGGIISARYSPTRETVFSVFLEMVHFVRAFPHPSLTMEILMTEVEEHRVPTRRKARKKFRVEDRLLKSIIGSYELRGTEDLIDLLPSTIPREFTTADIAREAGIPRWLAQKMAYCLRKAGGIELAGKVGNSLIYRIAGAHQGRAA